MTQTAEDAALIMNVISGFDKHDSTSVDKKIEDYTKSLNNSIKGLKIGLPKQYFEENLNSEVADITEAILIFISSEMKIGSRSGSGKYL